MNSISDSKHEFTGFAIALAWPQTYCKQPGAWYDGLMAFLGLSKNRFYKAGHSALVLVEKTSGKCSYYDFGRYHAPFQHGRVRSETTDHDLRIIAKARFSADGSKIFNFNEILSELVSRKACHGEGTLYASYCALKVEKSIRQATTIQDRSPLPYGPFVLPGTNCSRFVNTVILAGKPNWWYGFRLRFFQPFTPSPMGNVNALPNKMHLDPAEGQPNACAPAALLPGFLTQTMQEPDRPNTIPEAAQWLAGEGAGSWFYMKRLGGVYHISRYSPSGQLECEGEFVKTGTQIFNIDQPYSFVHLSHCRQVRIEQEGGLVEFDLLARKNEP